MIKFFPYYSVSLQSQHSKEACKDALSAVVEPINWFRSPFSKEHKDFQGVIADDQFKISRIIHYRNSFLPIICGRFKSSPTGGTEISLTMRMHLLVIVFMVVWFLGVGIACFASLHEITAVNRNAFALIPFGMFAVGVAMIYFCFWPEVNRAEKKLREIFNSKNDTEFPGDVLNK